MASLKAFALGAVAVVALSGAAAAADLLPPPPPMEPPPLAAPEMGGWYIRGDAGIGISNSMSAQSEPNPVSLPGGVDTVYNTNLSEAVMFDVGVGYQFNNWFRADLTGELRGGASFNGLETCVNCWANSTLNSDFYHGNLSTALAMVNGYVDLGTWYGITPFVGAGVGVAWNRMAGFTDQGSNYDAAGVGSPTGGTFRPTSTTNFAWALMTGFDLAVTRNLKMEFGYRFLDYGKFSAGQANCLTLSPPGIAGCSFKVASKELYSNDFRIGLRYYFDQPAPPPEMPLVRKY